MTPQPARDTLTLVELEVGSRLLHYRLTGKIGQGGMGVVWRAVDTALDREVAIKVLPAEVAGDSERLARFDREARLLASLSHTNIATIHGLHEHDGLRFLAMELVPGEDLAERLSRGPLPRDEALSLALQIADGLRAAHAAGVIHRDLKPANIRLTPGGQVRILDFGLAKSVATGLLSGSGSAAAHDPAAPTLTSGGTAVGAMLGTVTYMSPEQARGKPVDRRTDLWAFGCVLFEMLSGKRAFPGETASDTLAAILRGEPDWSALPADTPRSIRRLLRRCLCKEQDRRLQDVGDARLELEEALDPSLAGTEVSEVAAVAPPATSRVAGRLPWVLVLVLGLLSAALLLGRAGGSRVPATAPDAGDMHLSIELPPALTLTSGIIGGQRFAVAPDGSRVAFVARKEDTVRLYIRSLNEDRIVEVPDTLSAGSPFFSPDGKWVGFFRAAKLRKVAVSGGTPVTLADAPTARGGIWLPDDTIVYAPSFDSGFWRIPAAGGEPQQVTAPDRQANERTHRWPHALPGGRSMLFTIGTQDNPGAYDDAIIAAVDLESGGVTRLIEGGSTARYAAGHLIYARRGELLAVPFDPQRLKVSGAPVLAMRGVAGEATSGAVDFALTDSGAIVFAPLLPDAPDPQLVRVDRDGRAEVLPFEGRASLTPRLSPDGKRLAIIVGRGLGDGDLWIYDLERRRNTRLTFQNSAAQPIWRLDGSHVVYAFTRGGEEGLLSQALDATGEPERIVPWVGSSALFPDSYHPTRGTLLVSLYGGAGGSDIVALEPGSERPTPVVDGPHEEGGASFSPGGDWFAYVSDESGQLEIYARPYPGPGGKVQISTAGGKGPIWSRDGNEIFYTSGDRMMVVPVQRQPSFRAGEPRQLFRMDMRRGLGTWPDFAVSNDGSWFYLFRRSPETIEPRRIDIRFGFLRSLAAERQAG